MKQLTTKRLPQTAGDLLEDAKSPVDQQIDDPVEDVLEPEVDEHDALVNDFLTQTKEVNVPEPVSSDVTIDRRAYDDMQSELNYLRNKTEFFRSMLRGVMYRSDEEIEMEVGRAQQRINDMQYPALIKDYLRRTYPEHYWHNDPDIRFKAALAKGLYDAVKSRDPRCSYPPIETIVNGEAKSEMDASYDYLMSSYIER